MKIKIFKRSNNDELFMLLLQLFSNHNVNIIYTL